MAPWRPEETLRSGGGIGAIRAAGHDPRTQGLSTILCSPPKCSNEHAFLPPLISARQFLPVTASAVMISKPASPQCSREVDRQHGRAKNVSYVPGRRGYVPQCTAASRHLSFQSPRLYPVIPTSTSTAPDHITRTAHTNPRTSYTTSNPFSLDTSQNVQPGRLPSISASSSSVLVWDVEPKHEGSFMYPTEKGLVEALGN